MTARIKALPTRYNGIEFRSRAEAAWYACFDFMGFDPIYEPETFEIEMTYCHGNEDDSPPVTYCYLPDFKILTDRGPRYVELKPWMDKYPERDLRSLGLCQVLGYTHPSICLLGSVYEYWAFECVRRHKGCPAGWLVAFDEQREMWRMESWLSDGYPDEQRPESAANDPRARCYSKADMRLGCAGFGWNQTKYKRI